MRAVGCVMMSVASCGMRRGEQQDGSGALIPPPCSRQQRGAYTVLRFCPVQEVRVSICMTLCPGPEACAVMCRKTFRRFDYFTVSLSPERAINFTTNPGSGYLTSQVGFPHIRVAYSVQGCSILRYPLLSPEWAVTFTTNTGTGYPPHR